MNLKDKKGSISIFVLVALLFMSGFLIISFGSNINKSKTIKEQFNVITGIYSYTNGDEGAYDKAYTDLRKKNKQIITTSVENSNTIELTKTYEDKISNYRIYGNGIQDGTPTPDTPVEVQSVGDMVNIFDTSKTYGGWINHKEDGYSYEESSSYGTAFLEVKPNTTYCYSADVSEIDVGILSINLLYRIVDPTQYVDGNVLSIDKQLFLSGGTVDKRTFITDENTKMVAISYYRYNKIPKNIQLEEGTEATEYVPYGKCRIPVRVSGKNLFDGEWELGALSVDNGSVYPDSTSIRTKNYISIEKDTNYYFTVPSGKDYYLIIYKKDKTFSRHIGLKKNSFTFKITADEGYIKMFQKNDVEIPQNVQLEKGVVATQFQPYAKVFNIYLNEPLRKLGEYSDYIDFKTGKVVRNIRHIVLSGSNMTWSAYDDNQEDVLGFYTSDLSNHSPMARIYSLSNRFERSGDDIAHACNLGANYETFYINVYFKIAIAKRRVSDLQTFKTWLDENPTTIEYILETPTEEKISIPELNTYEDYTKIELLTQLEPSKIEVEYTGYTLD